MRILELDARAFGPLEGRALEVDSDVVLVYGRNETGKTSVRAAIETILYGFDPASRDAHPLARWNPDAPQTLSLRCRLQLDTGERIGVERVLQSAGRLRVAANADEFAGPRQSNRALPAVEWLSRAVFRELYSIELGQLAEIDKGARADIDDLLMPRTSALPLRAVSELRKELRDTCEKLWRSDRRGSPAARRLREALEGARARRAKARERDRELREARRERAELEAELASLRTAKRALERERDDAAFLGQLFDWNRRSRALGPAPDLTLLAGRRLARPSELDEEIEELERQLAEPRARLERERLALGDAQARICECAAEIERALATRARWEADRERLAEREQAARRARERACEMLRGALGGEPDARELERAARVPVDALASAAAEWSEARDRAFEEAARRRGRARIAEIAAAGAGLALIGFELYARFDPRLVYAGALLLAGALLVAAFARTRARGEAPASLRALAAQLAELAPPEALLETPAALQRLAERLAGVQRSLAEAREHEAARAKCEAQIGACERAWRELGARVGIEGETDVERSADRLGDALEAALAESERVERDRIERDEAQRLIDFETPALEAKREHRRRIDALLRAAEPDCGDPDAAFDRVEQRRAEAEYLRRQGAELARDPRFGRFERDPRVVAERPPDDAPWLPEICAARDAKLEAHDERLSEVQLRLGRLSEMLSADTAAALARAEETVLEIRDEIDACERERDRLALLESIVARAEREFRERHQPDVLRRASAYLERVSAGRYRRIDLLDEEQGALGVTLVDRDEPIRVGAPISRGALDQIYLCLRLGMLDHLDEGRERLPLILDDALLRMDEDRRRGAFALLADMAPTRQVWILTCNRALASEVEAGLKVTRIDL